MDKDNTIWSHLYMKSKKEKSNSKIQRTNWWVPDVGDVE